MRRFRVTSVKAPTIFVMRTLGSGRLVEEVEERRVEEEETSVARKREKVSWFARQVLRRSSDGPAEQRVDSWG